MSQPNHPFVAKYYEHPSDYTLPADAPPLVTPDTDVIDHNLFEDSAPAHSRNYMLGLDVLSWRLPDGTERSHLIVNQKAGSLVLPWEPTTDGNGVWFFLQETFRAPHPKDASVTVSDILARKAYGELGVWSLEAPSGGMAYVDGRPQETPRATAAREAVEETGVSFRPEDLTQILDPAGLHISGDVNTKITYMFLADMRKGQYDESTLAVEADEAMHKLLAFRVTSDADMLALVRHTRYDSSTTPTLLAAALQPEVREHFTGN